MNHGIRVFNTDGDVVTSGTFSSDSTEFGIDIHSDGRVAIIVDDGGDVKIKVLTAALAEQSSTTQTDVAHLGIVALEDLPA